MAKLDDGYIRNYRSVILKMSDGSMLTGRINLGDTFQRLSDLIRRTETQFITVASDESTEESKKVFVVNKNFIMWAESSD